MAKRKQNIADAHIRELAQTIKEKFNPQRIILELTAEPPASDAVCFHAQQCSEKYIKVIQDLILGDSKIIYGLFFQPLKD